MSQCPEHPLIMEKLDTMTDKLDSIHDCLTSGTDGRPGLLERVRNLERLRAWVLAGVGSMIAAAGTYLVNLVFAFIQRGAQ